MTDQQQVKIFVIEDSPDVLEGIMSILKFCGYQPEGVTRFNEEVFEQLKTQQYSLIILDVMLFRHDGREVATRLKSTKKIQDVPILMISAYHDVEDSAREAGADGFLPKPFGIEELVRKVEQHVKI